MPNFFAESTDPKGNLGNREGFDVVLGNPPWDALQPLAKEFYAAYDLNVLNAPTRREREAVEKRVKADPAVQDRFNAYVEEFDAMKRFVSRCYGSVSRSAGGAPSGAVTDVWQMFAERAHSLLREGGRVGWVLPSAFHANQSATGIRNLYLSKFNLSCCFSLENRRQLFEIHSLFKFANVVARKDKHGTGDFQAAFYLHDDEWLMGTNKAQLPLRYTRPFVSLTGGAYLTFMELRGEKDVEIVQILFSRRFIISCDNRRAWD